MRLGTDRHLLGHRERDAVVALAERADLRGLVEFLVVEVARRRPDDLQAAIVVGVIQLLQALELGREAAFARRVDEQRRLAAQRLKVERPALEQADRVGVDVAVLVELLGPAGHVHLGGREESHRAVTLAPPRDHLLRDVPFAYLSRRIRAMDLGLLLSQASHGLNVEMTARLQEVGITPRAYCVLRTALDQTLSQGEIATACDL